MPNVKKGQDKKEYISYCINWIKKNELDKLDWSDEKLYKYCEGLWKKHNTKMSNLAKQGYSVISFNDESIGMFSTNDGVMAMTALRLEDKSKSDSQYTAVDATVAVGDRFYGNIYVSSGVLKSTVDMWNGTYNDLSHMGTMYQAGLTTTENLEYITGYNSDAYYDEVSNAVRVTMHINHDAPKYEVWKNFVNVSRDAGRTPNVSIFGFSRFKLIKADSLPSGTFVPKNAVRDGYVVAMVDLTPFAVSTCLQGKCNDEAGCGISKGFSDSCTTGQCDIESEVTPPPKDDDVAKRKPSMSKEEIERQKYLRNRIKEMNGEKK